MSKEGSNKHQRLSVIRMSNDIASNIVPDVKQSKAEAIAAHMQRFWPPALVQILGEVSSKEFDAEFSDDIRLAAELLAR